MTISDEQVLDAALNFQSPKLAEFLNYWNSKQGGRRFPSRADIVPREIQQWMPMISMYDVAGPDEEFRIRLIGAGLAELLGGGDLRGKPISILPAQIFQRKRQALEQALKSGAPLRTFTAKTMIPGQEFQSLEACYAPLSSDGADIDVIIALMQLGSRK